MRPHIIGRRAASGLALIAATWSAAALAQEDEGPRRTRVALGPQIVPSFPGSDEFSVRPFVDVARARGTEPFRFEAPDESFGFSLLRSDSIAIGPVASFESKRTAKDVGAALPKVDFTFELGAFVELELAEPFRVRAEARRGLGGHEGWIGVLSADYVARDGDSWLFSIGPRVTFGNDRYHQAYFGVTPAAAAASGLPAFSADGGLQAVGATAGFIRQLTPRWGIYTYGKYDRLVDDAGRSPIVRSLGSRDQFSGGLALTYTFGQGVGSGAR